MDTALPVSAVEADDALKIGRKSGRGSRMEILLRTQRRRTWTIEQKQEIVSESLGAELTPTEVARKHGISSGQLYTWRQQLLGYQGSMVTQAAPRFAPVDLAPASSLPRLEQSAAQTAPSAPSRPEGLIEIVLSSGVSVRVDGHVDGRALRRVLDALGR